LDDTIEPFISESLKVARSGIAAQQVHERSQINREIAFARRRRDRHRILDHVLCKGARQRRRSARPEVRRRQSIERQVRLASLRRARRRVARRIAAAHFAARWFRHRWSPIGHGAAGGAAREATRGLCLRE
jgi:hypothetical protein